MVWLDLGLNPCYLNHWGTLYSLSQWSSMFRVFANGPGDWGSIQGWVIPKTQKMVLDAALPCLTLSIIRYGSRVKWSNPGKGVVSSPTPRCSSYQKRKREKLYIYIYIYMQISLNIIDILCLHIFFWIRYIYIYMQISLNIIDILCLHIFFWIHSNSRITFIVFGGNWFMYCP